MFTICGARTKFWPINCRLIPFICVMYLKPKWLDCMPFSATTITTYKHRLHNYTWDRQPTRNPWTYHLMQLMMVGRSGAQNWVITIYFHVSPIKDSFLWCLLMLRQKCKHRQINTREIPEKSHRIFSTHIFKRKIHIFVEKYEEETELMK